MSWFRDKLSQTGLVKNSADKKIQNDEKNKKIAGIDASMNVVREQIKWYATQYNPRSRFNYYGIVRNTPAQDTLTGIQIRADPTKLFGTGFGKYWVFQRFPEKIESDITNKTKNEITDETKNEFPKLVLIVDPFAPKLRINAVSNIADIVYKYPSGNDIIPSTIPTPLSRPDELDEKVWMRIENMEKRNMTKTLVDLSKEKARLQGTFSQVKNFTSRNLGYTTGGGGLNKRKQNRTHKYKTSKKH
jgi:hypothetical protein